ncbi:hypothetical protein BC332_13386 [Capsicum chinense]|nr:hypothetical protein BC332_13386 [Capsicum chinense]
MRRGRATGPDEIPVEFWKFVGEAGVPFVLVGNGRWPQPEYVNALFGRQYPVGVLDEEKILPLGKDITAVGVCSSKDGIFEIKSCKDLPYFLSDMTKDEMLLDLAFKSKVLLWSGVVLGSVAVGVLGYAVVRMKNVGLNDCSIPQVNSSSACLDILMG